MKKMTLEMFLPQMISEDDVSVGVPNKDALEKIVRYLEKDLVGDIHEAINLIKIGNYEKALKRLNRLDVPIKVAIRELSVFSKPQTPLTKKQIISDDEIIRMIKSANLPVIWEDRIFISDVVDFLMPKLGLSEAEIKTILVEAHRAGKISLRRAELVAAIHKMGLTEKLNRSLTKYKTAEFHFLAK